MPLKTNMRYVTWFKLLTRFTLLIGFTLLNFEHSRVSRGADIADKMFFFQLNFNYTSITSYKTAVQDISTFFATVRGIPSSKVMFTFYREALISFVSVTT